MNLKNIPTNILQMYYDFPEQLEERKSGTLTDLAYWVKMNVYYDWWLWLVGWHDDYQWDYDYVETEDGEGYWEADGEEIPADLVGWFQSGSNSKWMNYEYLIKEDYEGFLMNLAEFYDPEEWDEDAFATMFNK